MEESKENINFNFLNGDIVLNNAKDELKNGIESS
jgi:hypothetical protein